MLRSIILDVFVTALAQYPRHFSVEDTYEALPIPVIGASVWDMQHRGFGGAHRKLCSRAAGRGAA
jgi:hypothetical protein